MKYKSLKKCRSYLQGDESIKIYLYEHIASLHLSDNQSTKLNRRLSDRLRLTRHEALPVITG